LIEARIVGDEIEAIANALNDLRERFDYVFTSGGIGPTHDDITAEAIATAFRVPVIEHPRAVAMIEEWYAQRGATMTEARRRMARVPEGAELIDNMVSGAPGVRIGNVFVMAGVPVIFQGMLNALDPVIERGAVLHSRAVHARGMPESMLADTLRKIQADHAAVAFGSYPTGGDEMGVTVVARCEDATLAEAAIGAVSEAMRTLGFEPRPETRRNS
ncbi:MAG: competence/damage-inducible protein A, partial [Desulfuromonadales bacterium]|nr:competence/damage-inducible protein A [Desulfuromonadales bacterium]